MRCKKCGRRIWFEGSWGDAETPDTFKCHGYDCGAMNYNPARFYGTGKPRSKTA